MIHKCELCDYTTKNSFFFKRHKVRCRKEHGVYRARFKGRKKGPGASTDINAGISVDPEPKEAELQMDGTEAVAIGTAEEKQTDTHSEPGASEASSMVEEEYHSGPEVVSPDKAEPAKKRSYQCNKCSFLSRNSRKFLRHEAEAHGVSLSIYSCLCCQYSAKYRHKVLRHMRKAHDTDTSLLLDMPPEFVSGNQPSVPPKPRTIAPAKPKPSAKQVIIPKASSGRKKLMVKFGKRQSTLVPSEQEQEVIQESSTLLPTNVPAPQETDRLSRVVEEVVSGNGEVTFKCKECTFVSDDRQQVAKHAVSWHVDTKSFTCSHCDYITFERTDFIAHRLTHRNEHQFKCEECTYSTDFRPNYDRHMSNHRGSFPFKCSVCSFGCGSEKVIQRHMANNHTPIPTQTTSLPPPAKKLKLPVPKQVGSVDITPAVATNQLAGRSGSVSPEKRNVAPKRSPVPTEKIQAYRTPSPQKTPEKGQQVSPQSDPYTQSGANYLFQMSKVSSFLDSDSVSMVPRPTLPPPNLENAGLLGKELSPQRKLPPNITKYVEKDNGKLVCPVCKLKYKRSSDLNRHMKRKHSVKLREYLENFADSALLAEYNLIGLSDLSFGDDDDLDDLDDTDDINDSSIMEDGDAPLDLSVKTDSDESPVPPEKLKCKYCNYQAKWLSDLKRHYSVHSIEKRYKCNYCTKKYKYLGDLNVHVRKDHNKEPGEVKVVRVATMAKKKSTPAIFKCPCCNYTSPWKSEVDRHSRLHTGEKSFQCGSCDYQTHWRGDIRRHVYKHHPDIMVEGVAIDDVIIRKKVQTPLQLHGKIDSNQQQEQETLDTSIDSNFPSDSERMSREVTPVNMNASRRSHEPSPEVNMSDYVTKSVSGHSPTPSPIKELAAGMFKCQYCGFIANAPSKMDSHIATHTNLKRYMCPICGRRANWKWDIAKHIRRDHNDQITQVIKLGKQEAEETIQAYIDSNPVVRRDHHLNVTPEKTPGSETIEQYYKCSLCAFSADKRISVARHMRYMHVNVGQHGTIELIRRQSPLRTIQASPQDVNAVVLAKEPSPAESIAAEQTSNPAVFPQQMAFPQQTQVAQNSFIMDKASGTLTQNKVAHLVESFGPLDAARPFMCSECGKRGASKGDIKKHYHYAHADKEIRIIYLGDGSQSVYTAKGDLGSKMPQKPPGFEPEVATLQQSVAQTLENNMNDSANAFKSNSKHPKVVGYIKPFVCGLCGRRSNWRWDMSKHIRERHPGQDVGIIELSESEARATIKDYVSNRLPKLNKVSGSVPKRRSKELEPISTQYPEESTQSDVTYVEDIRSEQIVVEAEQTEKEQLQEEGSYSLSGASTVGQFKQYKCSGCAYRSNYRSDIQRHIPRRHGLHAKVIVLDKETAKATLAAYSYTRCYGPYPDGTKKSGSKEHAAGNAANASSGPLPKKAWAGLEKKIWKCSMCSYSNEDKVDVLKHVGKHNLKAYKCSACNWTSNFRSAVQRHIQSKHPKDELAQCRLSIKLIKEGPGVDQTGRSIMPEGMAAVQPEVKQSGNSTESLPGQFTAVTAQQSMNNPKSFMSTAMFHCRLCKFSSTWRSCVCRHILKIHGRKDYVAQIVKKIVRTSIVPQTSTPDNRSPAKMPMTVPTLSGARPRKKNLHCNVCPYKTYKNKMLKFHMTCHKPQPGVKQAKCKYCPYYVSSNRLLTQHVSLHLQDFKSSTPDTQYPTTPVKVSKPSPSRSPQVPKRHRCEKCPYTSNSKNDFLYHKQFHRPKPTADYKCDYCDYWVSHRRLIKQHMKVHEEGYYSETVTTPAKSEYSESSLVYDTVEIAALKQRIIASKITPSISQSPLVSPLKIASSCSMGGRRTFMRKDGTYRKIHQCKHCPYMNIRLRNMRLHELMHGKRSATHPLMKCPHCDYYVGSKGLLAHHMKVHQPNYGVEYIGQEKEKDRRDSRTSEDSEMDTSIPEEKKVDTLLEITRFKKYGCEKCPYASSKRSRFQRHVELHGSKQKCKCDFCDYSVPTMNLLNQHMRLHFEPNQNLLAAQSIVNLQFLPELPADVALASMMTKNDSKNPVSITHDHIDLYENQPEDLEPKKLYRCDRCPYANIRRDHLLAHLRCHMVKNEYACPYCDYSVGKTHVLVQHVKVHFSPLPEFSEWLVETGDKQRIKEVRNQDMKEAMEVVKLYQNEKKGESKVNGNVGQQNDETVKGSADADGRETNEGVTMEISGEERKEPEEVKVDEKSEATVEQSENTETRADDVKNGMNGNTNSAEVDEKPDAVKKDGEVERDLKEADIVTNTEGEGGEDVAYVCQYCDRDFPTSDYLVRHEMQHLIGNSYEDLVSQLLNAAEICDKTVNGVNPENQSNGEQQQTASSVDEQKPGTSGMKKSEEGTSEEKNEGNGDLVTMETD